MFATDSTKDTITIAYNENIYYDDSGWQQIPEAMTSTNPYRFINYRDWQFILNGEDQMRRIKSADVTFDAILASGATSGTLASNWTEQSGAYYVTFSNGDKRSVTLTNGADTATWSTGLSSGATADATTLVIDTPSTGIASFAPAFGREYTQ